MNPTGVIVTLLKANAVLSAALGGRIYGVTIPQTSAFPAIRVSIVGVRGNETKTGPSTDDRWVVQIDTYGTALGVVVALDREIRNTLDYYEGVVSVAGDTSYTVGKCVWEAVRDGIEEGKDLYFRSADYMLLIKNNL